MVHGSSDSSDYSGHDYCIDTVSTLLGTYTHTPICIYIYYIFIYYIHKDTSTMSFSVIMRAKHTYMYVYISKKINNNTKYTARVKLSEC